MDGDELAFRTGAAVILSASEESKAVMTARREVLITRLEGLI